MGKLVRFCMLAAVLVVAGAPLAAKACLASNSSTQLAYRIPASGDQPRSSRMRVCIHAGAKPQVYVAWRWPDRDLEIEGYPVDPLLAAGSSLRGPWGVGAVVLPRMELEKDGALRFSDPLRMHPDLEGARFRLPAGARSGALAGILQRFKSGQAGEMVTLEPVRAPGTFENPARVLITRSGVDLETGSIVSGVPMFYRFDHELRPLSYSNEYTPAFPAWVATGSWKGPMLVGMQVDTQRIRVDLDYQGTDLVHAQQGVNAAGVTMWNSTLAYDEFARLKSVELNTRRYGVDSPLALRRRVDISYYPGQAGALQAVDFNGKPELYLGYDEEGDPQWIVAPGRCVVFLTKMEENGGYRLAVSERVAQGKDSCLDREQRTRDGKVYLRPR